MLFLFPIGFFENSSSSAFTLFFRLAQSLRDECKFIVSFKSNSPLSPVSTYPQVSFRDRDLDNEVYKFGFELESAFRTWLKQKCVEKEKERDPIQPPLSSFKNLKPSGNRYSFRDEL